MVSSTITITLHTVQRLGGILPHLEHPSSNGAVLRGSYEEGHWLLIDTSHSVHHTCLRAPLGWLALSQQGALTVSKCQVTQSPPMGLLN